MKLAPTNAKLVLATIFVEFEVIDPFLLRLI